MGHSSPSGDYGKAVVDESRVLHIASHEPYRTVCGIAWVALAFAWETTTMVHCRVCIKWADRLD